MVSSSTNSSSSSSAAMDTDGVVPPSRRTGRLTVRIIEVTGLQLPPSEHLPSQVRKALEKHRSGKGIREQGLWYLPYVVLGFDMNEVMIDAYGGDFDSPIYCYETTFDVSRASEITLSVYLRTESKEAGELGKNDIFIGGVNINPRLDVERSTDMWLPSTAGSGSYHVGLIYKPESHQHLSMESFELLKVLGKGSYGKVFQVKKKDTQRIYAMKVLKKSHIAAKHEVLHTLTERTVLAQVNNPFIVHLKYSFQTSEKLYLVMPYINGGELFHHLRKEGIFDERRSIFYAAELLCALEHLHLLGVVYRDLKPENILLTVEGHAMLCDFGLCKLDMYDNEKTNTFCGTPDYVAPEVLLGRGYTNAVDFWTLGILIYEMLAGYTPFYHENKETMYTQILHAPLRFPEKMHKEARTIIFGLCTRDANKRLGHLGAQEIKAQPFFAKVDWVKMAQRKIKPPFKPTVESPADVSNIDADFLAEQPVDSVVKSSGLSESFQRQFEGFTYEDHEIGTSLKG